MTDKERFINCVLGREIDRTPFMYYFGLWGETVEEWRKQGVECPEAAWCSPEFGFDKPVLDASGSVNMLFCPEFETKIIEQKDHTYIYQDFSGSIKEAVNGKSGIPKVIKNLVETREDWEKVKKERLNLDFEKRMKPGFIDAINYLKESGSPIQIGQFPCGLFGTLRDMMGVEELCVAFYDDPELIHDMMWHFTNLWIAIYEEICKYIQPDIIHIWEDMSGKSGSIISPAMVEEFMIPCYKKIHEFACRHGIEVISLDTDGICDQLIPVFAKGGVNLMLPFEVAAGNDVTELRKRFPYMAMLGGIDKMEIAKGKEEIDRQIDLIEPLLSKSGYIPAFDHLVPPDVSYENYVYFMTELKKRIYKHKK